MNIFAHQHKDYGIGNFINCTPALQIVANHINDKVPVLFDTRCVGELFENCSFIKIIDSSHINEKKLILSSSLVNQKIEDWKYQCQLVEQTLQIKIGNYPHTYVDSYASHIKQKYAVIVRGMCADYWAEKKDPGDDIYHYIIDDLVARGYDIVFIGSTADYERNIQKMSAWANNITVLDDIKKSLGVINGADVIISNDTGMYHAAGALNKDIFIMWKETNFIKNKSPGSGCVFSMKDNWRGDFEMFMRDRK